MPLEDMIYFSTEEAVVRPPKLCGTVLSVGFPNMFERPSALSLVFLLLFPDHLFPAMNSGPQDQRWGRAGMVPWRLMIHNSALLGKVRIHAEEFPVRAIMIDNLTPRCFQRLSSHLQAGLDFA